MSDRLDPIAVRQISKKGGSIYITIPSKVVELLKLELGDSLAFFKDKKSGEIIIKKVTTSYVTDEGFSFSIPKKRI